MLIFNIIFMVCVYPVLFILYFVMKSSKRSKKNVIFGVTLPSDYLDDPEVNKICKQYDKELNKYTLIYAVLPISFFFVKYFSISYTLWMIWILLVIFMSGIPYIKYNKKLKTLKTERQWKLSNEGKTLVDMTSTAEHIRTVKTALFLPPIILSLIPCIYELFHITETNVFLVNFIVLLSTGIITPLCLIIAILMDKQKLEVISFQSVINTNFNRAKKHIWSKCFLTLAWVNTLFTYAIWLLTLELLKSTMIFLIITFVYSIIVGYVCIRSGLDINKIRLKAVSEMASETDNTLIDDDANWLYGMMYYNPNDTSFMVDKRVGIGTTINMASTAGKWIAGFTFLVLLTIPLSCVWVMISEFTPINLNISNNQLIAKHIKTDYIINIDDIKDIKLIEKLPKADRRMGTGMDNLLKGDFSVEGYGDCELFLNPQNKDFIVIKTAQKTYILSDDKNSGTKQIYNEIRE